MKKLQYIITFFSEPNETKKQAILTKIQTELAPYVVNGTIEAASNAIEIKEIDVGEFHPIVTP